ncbi:hypothetical protein Cgig2_012543 [Carnegiea gigantea]|uniref:Reverse transcriptase n=1 Tax=Carnegiea gigantea TaxID=171969 RepID=A0A9Q1JJ12_9CARY|nr:hypothetical protein Cgig2_012543 [Carnegiea gigantea]
MKRQRKLIEKIRVDGELVSDKETIRRAFVRHFKQIYKKEDSTTLDLPQLTQADAGYLDMPVTTLEIEEALLSCHPSKSPGYDGFNLKCIRKVWPLIGEEFCQYIHNFFKTGVLNPSVNTTWVTLIPKKQGTTVLILLKGVLFARSSHLISNKANLGFRFPCDGPGRGGICQVSA